MISLANTKLMAPFRRMYVLAAFITCLCVWSCGRATSFVADAPVSGWMPGEGLSLTYPNSDTLSLREIRVFMVHEYGLQSKIAQIPLQITVMAPDSTAFSEEWVFYPEARPQGKATPWHESRIPYRRDSRFRQQGNYIFTFSHDLPRPLNGVRAVGIEIKQ